MPKAIFYLLKGDYNPKTLDPTPNKSKTYDPEIQIQWVLLPWSEI